MKNIFQCLTKTVKSAWNGFLDLLFPKGITCLDCGKDVSEGYFCEDCFEKFPKNDGKRCEHCSRPTVGEERFCETCTETVLRFDKASAPFLFDGEVQKLIHKLKFNDARYLAEPFAKFMAEDYEAHLPKCDVVTFVPSHPKNLKARGYNQSELLAKAFAEFTGLPCRALLSKIKETPEQVGLTREERRKNLKHSFKALDKSLVKDKSVLLIDDVITTGATADECARILKLCGAKSVCVQTVACTVLKKLWQKPKE